ncbi:MAG: hypothetical protein ABSG76_12600 [Xanthobacteraceae bacterium]
MTDILARQRLSWRAPQRGRVRVQLLAAVRRRRAGVAEPILPVAAAGVAFLLAASLLGPFNPGLTQVLLIAALATLAVPAWRASAGRRGMRVLVAIAPLLPAALAPLCGDDGEAARLAGTAVAVAVLAQAARGHRGGDAMSAAAWMVGVAILLYLGQRHVTPLWRAFEAIAGAVSVAAGALAGEETRLGPIAAGLWPGLLGVVLAIPALRYRPVAAVTHLMVVVVAVVAYAAFQMPLERSIAGALQLLLNTAPAYLNDLDQPNRIVPGGLTGFSSLVVLAVVLVSARVTRIISGPPAPPPANPVQVRGGSLPRGALVALGLLAIAAGAALAGARSVPPPVPGRAVAFYDGDLDLSKPLAGRYGLVQSGMYGSMWDLLERAGYRCRRITDAELAEEGALAGVSALVVIMPRKVLAPDAHQAVWRFVDRGGGLLVLGDHTDLFGVMEPLDRLLDPVGVRFMFDSAFPVRRHWQYALDVRPHPITAGIPDQVDIQIGTGASLQLVDGRASPVIVGRYAFGDFGNRLNVGRGGLLGDYRYQVGERLGDLPVVAAAAHGQGRVIVFGDTSTFQVLALPSSADFVERILRWLSVPPPDRPGPWPLVGGLLLAAAGLLLLLLYRPAGALALVAAAVAVGDASHQLLPRPQPATFAPAASMAVVDVGTVPRFPFEFFADDSYGGVFTALFRAGYFPLSNLRRGSDLLEQSGFAAFVLPTQAPSAGQRRAVAALLARGGTLLVVDGRPDPAAANALLAECGLRVGSTPLGPVHVPWGEEVVDFVDAWPVTAAAGRDVKIDAQWENFALIAETRVGPGRCIAVGDGRFLADKRFEGEFQFHPVNLRFFDHLLEGRPSP